MSLPASLFASESALSGRDFLAADAMSPYVRVEVGQIEVANASTSDGDGDAALDGLVRVAVTTPKKGAKLGIPIER